MIGTREHLLTFIDSTSLIRSDTAWEEIENMTTGKIAYFIPTLKLAGTSTQALVFCETMSAAGYDVDLVVSSKSGVFLDAVMEGQYSVHYLKRAKFFTKIFTIFYLMRYLRQHKPGILFGGAKGVNKLAIYAKLLSFRSTKLAVILTNDLLQRTYPTDRGRAISRRWHFFLYRFADHVIVLTEAMKRHFLSQGYEENKITVLPPPISLKAIEQKSREPLNHPWFQEPRNQRDIPVILAVGRIALQKNYPLLLEAFKIARETRPLRLIIVGAGTEKATAETKQLAEDLGVRDHIDFAGFSSNPFHYMQQCDLFALSSHWEGFGIVVAEALACGITVASVDCPDGPSEILDGTKYGYLAKPHDPESLAQALLDGVDRPVDPAELVHRATDYDGPVIGENYRRLIQSMDIEA